MSCERVAYAYQNGVGLPKDKAQTEIFYSREAAALKHKCDAGKSVDCSLLDNLRAQGHGK